MVSLAGFIGTPAQAQTFSNIFVFGDSQSDTGRFLYLPLIKGNPATLATVGGFTTNPGLQWPAVLGQRFGIAITTSAAPGGGNNYAAGGARVVFESPFTNAWSTASQIASYLGSTGGVADPNALYVYWVGINDLKTSTTGGPGNIISPPNNTALLTLAQQAVDQVSLLSVAGARFIVVPNTNKTKSAESAAATGFAFNPINNSSKQLYDQAVWNGIAARGINFIPADFTTLLNYIGLNPGQFGITNTNVNTPACGTALNSTDCGPANYVTPNADRTYLFADGPLSSSGGAHLTTAGHQIFGDYIYSLIVAPSQISFLAETPVKSRLGLVATIQNQLSLSASHNGPGGYNGWASGDVGWLKADNAAGYPGDPGRPVTMTAGFDLNRNGWLFGAAFGLGYSRQIYGDNRGSFKQSEGSASLYAANLEAPLWYSGVLSYGRLLFDVNRDVPLGISLQNNSASTKGHGVSFAGEAGYRFVNGALTHGPVAGAILQHVTVSGFSESGGITALSFGKQTRNSAISELGYQFTYAMGAWSPYAKVVWNHELSGKDRQVTAFLTTISAPGFSMPAVVLGRDWGTGTLGASVKVSDRVTTYAAAISQFAQNSVSSYSGHMGVNVSF